MSATTGIVKLTPDDVGTLRQMLAMFGAAFEDAGSYCDNPPSDTYLRHLLGAGHFIALAATIEDAVIGGLAAYELRKFEQERSEIYIYDLAVSATHRRRGVATALVEALKVEAVARGAYVIYVQADRDDLAATELYAKLGRGEDVLHFDIALRR